MYMCIYTYIHTSMCIYIYIDTMYVNVHVCDVYLCHSTCVKLTQEYFVVCMVEQRNKCKTRTTKRPAGPAWFCRILSSLGCSRERTAYQCKSVLHDSTILKILPSYAYQKQIQKQSKTSLSCYFQKHTTGCLSVGARVFIFDV